MKNINYLDILKQACLITWKNKFLWFFGFLIFLGSIGSDLRVNDNGFIAQGEKNQYLITFIQNNPTLSFVLGVILILIVLVLFLLRIMAFVSIVKSVNNIKLYQQLSTTSILKESGSYLGKLIWLEIIVGSALFVIGFVLAIPVLYLFALKAKILSYFALALAISIALPLIILAYYLIKYGSFYVILTNERLRVALESAYALFSKNIKDSLIMGLIIVMANIALVATLLLLLLPAVIVFAPLGLIAHLLFAKTAAIVVAGIAILVYLIIAVAIVSWYESFVQTCWLLFFQQIAFEKHKDKEVAAELEVVVKTVTPESI